MRTIRTTTCVVLAALGIAFCAGVVFGQDYSCWLPYIERGHPLDADAREEVAYLLKHRTLKPAEAKKPAAEAFGAAASDPLPATRPNRPHPGYGVLLKPLRSDDQYAAFGTKGQYTPFPTDVAGYYRNPAKYPWHAYHGPQVIQSWYVDSKFWSLPTSVAGVSQGNAIEEAIWDLGCVSGLGVKLTPNPGEAVFEWRYLDAWEVVKTSRQWRSPFTDGNASAYLTIQPGARRVYLGGVNKQDMKTWQAPTVRKRIWGKSLLMVGFGVPYAGLPANQSPYGIDEPRVWGTDPVPKNWLEYPAMRSPFMSAPIEHLEGWGYWNHGYDSWEIGRLRQAWGHQPWLYRWDRQVKR